jgi:TPP-dependent pyruvate/acetoin dehydrogenase alpha subunit
MYDEVEEAIQFALDSPYPEPETALEDVFAERTVTL